MALRRCTIDHTGEIAPYSCGRCKGNVRGNVEHYVDDMSNLVCKTCAVIDAVQPLATP